MSRRRAFLLAAGVVGWVSVGAAVVVARVVAGDPADVPDAAEGTDVFVSRRDLRSL